MSGGERENAPNSGTEAGRAGEDRAGHQNIIGDSIAPDAAGADQNSLGPDADAAVEFLEAWRPGGPWVLTAIEVDGAPDAPTPTHTLTTADAVRRWIHDHSGGRWNLYFTPNVTRGHVRKKPKKADMAEAVALFCDVDPRAGEPLDPERRASPACSMTGRRTAGSSHSPGPASWWTAAAGCRASSCSGSVSC